MADAGRSRSQRRREDFNSLFEGDPKKREKLSAFSEKAAEVNKKRAAERKAKAAKRKSKMDEITSTLESRKAARKSATSKPSRPNPNPRGRVSRGARAASAGSSSQAAASSGAGKAQPRFGVGKEFTIRGGKANVRKDQLEKTGLTQAAYMKQWRASGNRPTAKAKSVPRVVAKAPGLTGKVKSILLGKDQKFGGDRGLVDFLPGKSRKKKPVKKMGGGMMKSKMASKGGARGGMKAGGLAMTMVNGRKVPAFAADGKGAKDLAKKKNGGMMKSKGMSKGGAMKKKGMARGGMTGMAPPPPMIPRATPGTPSRPTPRQGPAGPGPGVPPGMRPTSPKAALDNRRSKAAKKKQMMQEAAARGAGRRGRGPGGMKAGGMAKKGYSKGGAVRSKMASKGGKRGGASRKPRGVGAALRGYGKALK